MSGYNIAVTWLLITAAVSLLWWLALRWLRSRRNDAGLSTGLATRSAQISGLATRTAGRRAALALKGVVAGKERREKMEAAYHIKTAQEASAMMGQMKGVFMKLGQIVSFANDALPEEAKATLKTLQKDAPAMAFPLVRDVVERELGESLEQRFRSFDEVPLASASIGQVHRAVLHDGRQVVLKVQYPGVDEAIESDLRFTDGLASLISTFHKNADAKAIVAELKERLIEEVDYRKELANQQLFYAIWDGHPLIRIPRPHPEHSTKRVLCQEFVAGLTFDDFRAAATLEETRAAALVLNDFVFDSMHLFEAFNGDPHPGNYIFHEDGGITFIDFGCVKRFSGEFLPQVRAMNRAIVAGDRERFDELILAMGIILPGRKYPRDMVWEFFQYHSAPFREDREFEFNADYIAEAREVMRPGQLSKLNLPPDLIFFNRITFGLNAIFEQLGASANWHRLYERYLSPEANVGPACAALDVSLPDRFVAARRWRISLVDDVAKPAQQEQGRDSEGGGHNEEAAPAE